VRAAGERRHPRGQEREKSLGLNRIDQRGRGPAEHVLIGQSELARGGRRLPAHHEVRIQDHRHVG
jgi:hypothetical protein